MKKFSIKVGARELELIYTSLDAIQLKKRFGKAAFVLFNVDLLHDQEVQAAVLAIGARHKAPKVLDDDFLGTDRKPGWIDEYVKGGGEMRADNHGDAEKGPDGWVTVARKAAYAHGVVTGKVEDLDAEDDEGKGQTPETDQE